MQRNLRNTISVLLATALTTLVVFMTVQYGVGSVAPAEATSQTLVCPRTGCTASSCHATGGPGGGFEAGGHERGDTTSLSTQG